MKTITIRLPDPVQFSAAEASLGTGHDRRLMRMFFAERALGALTVSGVRDTRAMRQNRACWRVPAGSGDIYIDVPADVVADACPEFAAAIADPDSRCACRHDPDGYTPLDDFAALAFACALPRPGAPLFPGEFIRWLDLSDPLPYPVLSPGERCDIESDWLNPAVIDWIAEQQENGLLPVIDEEHEEDEE